MSDPLAVHAATLEALDDDERTQLAEMRAKLAKRGYIEIDQHKRLRPGARIRHRNEQYYEAIMHGTGVVLVLTEKPDSSWSNSWGMPDIELIVLRDKARFGSRLSGLAQYHVDVAGDWQDASAGLPTQDRTDNQERS